MNPSEISEGSDAPAAEQPGPEVSRPAPVPPIAASEPGWGPSASSAASLNPSPLNPAWLRLAYAMEFFVAVIAIISLWSEVGGESHLDLMPWYFKLGCIAGLAWCCVRFTAGMVEQQKVWTLRTSGWFAGILLFCVVMGGITYYYHLHEESDDGDDDTAAATARIYDRGIFFR